ncbi:MAG TPA: glycosyl hydrolase family 28-related protein, partial [Leptolyngbyaceae cyanobacterium]
NITLQNQKEYGLANYGQVISIRKLQTNNSVPVVYNKDGIITLIDAKLTATGTSIQSSAIKNDSTLFARNIKTSGYQTAIQNNNGTRRNATSSLVSEFVSHPIHNIFSTPPKSLNLPIEETPEVQWDALSNWESPTHFGAVLNDNVDDSAAIQAAIDSGKTTVYFPNGNYIINQTIYLRNNVKRIIGLEASIAGKGNFRFENGKAPVVVIERLDGVGSGIIHAASRTLVLSSMGLASSGGKASYSNIGTGKLFVEDVVGGPWTFNRQKVWARQLNPENDGTHISNNGGSLWILGLKTERGGILVETKAGAKTEIAGGFIYSTSTPKTTPMFANENSAVSLTIGECNFNRNFYKTLVSESRNGVLKTLDRGNTPQHCNGSIIPLYVGYK